jgi:hypothetical protein
MHTKIPLDFIGNTGGTQTRVRESDRRPANQARQSPSRIFQLGRV